MLIPAGEIDDIISQQIASDGSLIAVLEAVQGRFGYLPPEALAAW